MAPAKEDVKRILELLPDDASLEDIQYRIYVCQKLNADWEMSGLAVQSQKRLSRQGCPNGSNRKMD